MANQVTITKSELREMVSNALNTILEEYKNTTLSEKSVSKAQQRFFGMVDAYKKGETENPSKSVKDAAEGMTKKEVKDFASTKHKGLPNHVKNKK